MTFLNEIEQKHELYIADSPCDEKHMKFLAKKSKRKTRKILFSVNLH